MKNTHTRSKKLQRAKHLTNDTNKHRKKHTTNNALSKKYAALRTERITTNTNTVLITHKEIHKTNANTQNKSYECRNTTKTHIQEK